MRKGRMAKLGLALVVATLVLAVPATLYAASFKAAQARTPYFLDAGTAGATVDWQSILVVQNPNAYAVYIKATWYGSGSVTPWACGYKYNHTTQLAACGPETLAANNHIRFHTQAFLPAIGGLYQGHIKLQTTNVNDKVIVDGWIYAPGAVDATGKFLTGKDGRPTMRGGFHQEWVVDDDLYEAP